MSAPTPFVHLHCHTDYSLLDGACEITQLMDLVVEQKMPSVAMTDHGNLFGAVEFYNEAKANGIHPVIGCEVYVAQQGHTVRSDSSSILPRSIGIVKRSPHSSSKASAKKSVLSMLIR